MLSVLSASGSKLSVQSTNPAGSSVSLKVPSKAGSRRSSQGNSKPNSRRGSLALENEKTSRAPSRTSLTPSKESARGSLAATLTSSDNCKAENSTMISDEKEEESASPIPSTTNDLTDNQSQHENTVVLGKASPTPSRLSKTRNQQASPSPSKSVINSPSPIPSTSSKMESKRPSLTPSTMSKIESRRPSLTPSSTINKAKSIPATPAGSSRPSRVNSTASIRAGSTLQVSG